MNDNELVIENNENLKNIDKEEDVVVEENSHNDNLKETTPSSSLTTEVNNHNSNNNNIDINKSHIYILPSSSNWYCSQISDCNSDGIYIYASKSTIFLFDINIKQFIGKLVGHTDRILSVCFHKVNKDLCISSSIDKTVRLWNIKSLECVSYHSVHKNEVTTVIASSFDGEQIISGDRDGRIVLWRSNDIRSMVPLKSSSVSPITSMAFSINKQYPNLIAIGYQNGLVLLFDFITQSIVSKLNAHSDEIQSIVWIKLSTPITTTTTPSKLKQKQKQQQVEEVNSTLESDENSNNSNDSDSQHIYERLAFATSSKDKTIKVWKQAGDNVDSGFHTVYTLNPAKSGSKQQQSNNPNEKSRVWLTLSWSADTPNYLISSSLGADMLLWNLTQSKPLPERIPGNHHQRTIFNITICPFQSLQDISTVKHPPLITTSMDRNMIYWESNNKVKWKISALGGFVYCITSSQFSPKTIVIGCGDNIIRQWSPDIDDEEDSNNLIDNYESKSYWKGIQSKITALDINPKNSSQLAFGLDDGRVGIYDTERNHSIFFPGAHRKEIYEIQWRLISNNNSYKLYSLGNGDIFEWDPEKLDHTYKNINDYIKFENGLKEQSKIQKSEFCWNHSFNMIIISTHTGTLELYDSSFKLLATLKHHKSLVNRIRWNPHPDRSNYFATASLDKTIGIFRVINEQQPQTPEQESATTPSSSQVRIELVCQFKDHKAAVFGISWSPHDKSLLSSCSADGTAQIWNIDSIQPIANIRGHDGRVLTVHWSYHYPNVVFTGGEDQTVRMWDYQQQPYRVPPTDKSKKDKLKPINETILPTIDNATITPLVSDSQDIGSPQLSSPPSSVSINNNTNSTIPESTTPPPPTTTSSNITTTIKPTVKKSKVILPLLYKVQQKDDQTIINLAKRIKDSFTSDDGDVETTTTTTETTTKNEVISNDGVFSLDNQSIKSLLQQEMTEHLNSKEYDHYVSMNMWPNNNLKQALQKIVKSGQLNAHYVALSAQCGRDVYQSMCQLYSKQLIIEGDYHMAVSYLLAINKVVDAIEVYRKGGFIQEAILLAKQRLPSQHEIIQNLFLEWGQQSEESNIIQCIKCYLSANKPELAIEVLKKRSSSKSNQILLEELESLYNKEKNNNK